MPVLMFWNVKEGSAIPYLADACFENQVDILILAEDKTPPGYTISMLNATLGLEYQEYHSIISKLKFFFRPSSGDLSVSSDLGERCSIRSFRGTDGNDLLIMAVHVQSKLHYTEADQYRIARDMRNAIDEAERRANHKNSLVIGDFNMNPFEQGMMALDGFHAMMDKTIALKGERSFQGNSFSFFYNPMWSKLGCDSAGPPGTYYYNSSGVVNYYWNTFDQVLIRPALISFYKNDTVKVLSKIGSVSLLKKGKIDTSISDHLPIVVKIEYQGGVS